MNKRILTAWDKKNPKLKEFLSSFDYENEAYNITYLFLLRKTIEILFEDKNNWQLDHPSK